MQGSSKGSGQACYQNSAARAVPVSKILFREVNACIYTSKQPNWGGTIGLSEEAVRDLLWIIECFLAWNGRSSPIWVDSMVKTVDHDCVLVQDAGPRTVGFAVHNMRDIRAVDAPGGLPSVEAGVQQLVPTEVLVDAVLDKHTLYASSGTIELTDVEADMHHVHKELVGCNAPLHSLAKSAGLCPYYTHGTYTI